MKKRPLLTTLAILILLIACGPDGEKTPASTSAPVIPDAGEERTTLSFAVYDWERTVYGNLVELFEATHPDVRVRLVSFEEIWELDPTGSGHWPDDAWQRLTRAADVINMPADHQAVQQGLVRDLAPFIEAERAFQPEDFYPNALEAYRWEGGAWSLPTSVGFELIFYDKDAFDEVGMSYPEPGWTWDDLLGKARALTRRDGERVIRWGFVQPRSNHLPFIEGRVGALIDTATEPPTPHFDRSEVVEAVRWYADLYLVEQVTPYFEATDEPVASEGQQLIERGQAAMWRDFSTSWQRRQLGGNVGVAPFPVDAPDSHSTPLASGWGLSMSAGTAHPNAAWRWMDFLSRQAIVDQEPFNQLLPARRSAAEASGFWDKADAELARVLRYSVDHSYAAHWTTGYEAFSEALETILSGEKSVEDALGEAQAKAKLQESTLTGEVEATSVPTPFIVATPEGSASKVTTTITFITIPNVLGLQPYRDLARQFQETHPDIVVEVSEFNFMDGAFDMKNVAKAADCFQWMHDFYGPENRASILNLNPFLDADPSFTTDDFYPPVLEQFTWQGQLWGLPAEVWPYVIEYNKDLFDAADVDYPILDWTTDDLLELAVALTQGEGRDKQYGFVTGVPEDAVLRLIVERLGARLVNDRVDPPAVSFNDPTTIEAVRWYVGLSTEWGVRPVFDTEEGSAAAFMEQEALINDGRVAMWTVGAQMTTLFGHYREGVENVGVVPLPAGPDGSSAGSYLEGSGYFISAHTQARDACWKWITFLTGQQALAQGLPARRSVAESAAYRQRVGDEWAAAFRASLSSSERPFASQSSAEAWLSFSFSWLAQAYEQALTGKASVEEALNAAQKMADDYRACIVIRQAFSDENEWRVCMRQVDPILTDSLFGPGEGE